MAQHSIGDKAVSRDALATYRKLDERINAQMLSAMQVAESGRAPTAPIDAVQDSKAAGLSGIGLPSVLEAPTAGAGGKVDVASESAAGASAPPAAFRMGSRSSSF